MAMTAPAFVPLAMARRRYGRRALGLSILALALVALVLVAQSPPSLRRGSVALALILIAMCIGVGALSLLWTWMIVWPTQDRELRGAKRLPAGAALPPGSGSGREPLSPFVVLVVGGLLVGLVLWGFLNTVGLVGAPMLWIVAGTINLEVARRVRRVERADDVVYYETPLMLPFKGGQRLFVQLATGAGGHWTTVAERRAALGGRKRATTGRAHRG